MTAPDTTTDRYPTYPDTRPSGIEWLGDIPAHWEMRRLKTIASVMPSNVDKKSNEDEIPIRLCNYTDVYYNERITADIEFMEATATSGQIARFRLRAGDVIITKDSESANDIAVPAYVPANIDGVVCGYHLALIRSHRGMMDGNYVFYSFMTKPLDSQFEIAANGITRYGIPQHGINDAWFVVPPPDEQRAIAAFLDRETAKIDALIAAKERFIALLTEKRSAVISHAVTKGLDPDAPMKDSGVEWLGEIPAGWEVVQMKYACSAIKDGLHETPAKHEEGIPFISTQHVRNRRIAIEDATYISHADYSAGHPRIAPAPDDVLITLVGSIGFAAIVEQSHFPLSLTRHVGYVRPRPEMLLSAYLVEYVESSTFKAFIEMNISQVAQPSIYLSSLATYLIPLPPIDEQRAIVDHLFSQIGKIESIIDKTRETIALLREQRAALISAAVTGVIDVRGAV